jgi:hypothetical protein
MNWLKPSRKEVEFFARKLYKSLFGSSYDNDVRLQEMMEARRGRKLLRQIKKVMIENRKKGVREADRRRRL